MPSFRPLSCPSPRGAGPAFRSACQMPSSSRANISTRDMRFQRSARALSVSSAVKLIAQITSSITLGVKNLAEIRIGGSLAGGYFSLARRSEVVIALAVQAHMGSALPSFSTLPRWGVYSHLKVMSRLSPPPGSNRPGFCLAVLWASSNSLAPFFANVYNRFSTYGANCGCGVYETRERKSRIDTCGGSIAEQSCRSQSPVRDVPRCTTEIVRMVARAVFGKRLSDGQVR
ncbi:hypothetical protein Acr_06g0002630 [Actinidia rufa]|uniref:Uncharacterized protein n=1 Tax=Actinidia rufa TaxID=165716 RepID=A0A7J0EPF5_9ERIC|nr:hypothetical protein Acr_06g0002630 [Actinidia rufa]